MFTNVVCPDPAYNQLKKSGITDIILGESKRELISDILLYSNLQTEKGIPDFGEISRIFEANKFNSRDAESLMCEDLLLLKKEYESEYFFSSSSYFESLLAKYPVYFGYVVLGNELLNYNKFGFNSRTSLEKAITSFCLGERHEIRRFEDEWVWRNAGFKNCIFRNMHGDLHVSQVNSSGKDYIENTFFGDERIFDCMKDIYPGGFGAYQDWSQFLVSLLKYSEKVGMANIPEISNWKGTLEKLGGGTSGAYAEAFGGLTDTEFRAHMLLDHELMSNGKKLDKWPLIISEMNFYSLPFFENEKLFYLRQDKNGEIEFPSERFFDNKKFSKVVEYNPDDLPHAMKGCLKYFARSRLCV